MYFSCQDAIRSHYDAQDYISRFSCPIRFHFYELGYCNSGSNPPADGLRHLSSSTEVHEFLDLLLHLTKTFPQDNNPEFIRVSNIDFNLVLSLMVKAQIELSEHDKRQVLDYTALEAFDCDYLNYACQIRDAFSLVEVISDLWYDINVQAETIRNASEYETKLHRTPFFRLIKRWRLARELCFYLDCIEENKAALNYDGLPRVLNCLNEVYRTDFEYLVPLIFYRSPSLPAGQVFFDDEIAGQAQAEWESCRLHTQLGDAKLARLLDLLPSFRQSPVHIYIPDCCEEIEIKTYQDCMKYYPELSDYYHLLEQDLGVATRDDYSRFQVQQIDDFNRRVARAFHCEAYLGQANNSCRRPLPKHGADDEMSPEMKQIADSIIEFMEDNT